MTHALTTASKTRPAISLGILLASLGLAYAPFGGSGQRIVVVSGTELQEPLRELVDRYHRENSGVTIDLQFQGSQDIVNNLVDRKNDFDPALVIPANGELLKTLETRLKAQGLSTPFQDQPQPVAKTLLVAIAWPERAKTLFPSGNFSWNELEKALQSKNWGAISGQAQWGSFDFLMTDPSRSNSGQLTLGLWAKAKTGQSNIPEALGQSSKIEPLFNLLKKSVYQPPRSTDILLQEFISRGPNDADMATVYESVALNRWKSAKVTKGQPYQIFYPETTIETVATGVVLTQNIELSQQKQASAFLNFLRQASQQEVLVRHGFRPIQSSLDMTQVAESPWAENIPGIQVNAPSTVVSAPDEQITTELIKQWQRAK
jgi:ABC-type molybdate transport system substrate-binding protein